jgi:hypothetical protein
LINNFLLPGAIVPLAADEASIESPPPNHGLMWFKDTCSINEVPYLDMVKLSFHQMGGLSELTSENFAPIHGKIKAIKLLEYRDRASLSINPLLFC